jgi:hypothetical protein
MIRTAAANKHAAAEELVLLKGTASEAAEKVAVLKGRDFGPAESDEFSAWLQPPRECSRGEPNFVSSLRKSSFD